MLLWLNSLVLSLEFLPERDAEFFAAIPAAPAVFLLRAADPQAEPYVSKTTNLKRRLTRLLSAPEERVRRLNLRDRVRHVEYTLTGSDFESGLLLYRTLRRVFPESYRDRLRLRFAPLVKFNLDNPWPRAYITQRITRLRGASVYYGPFPTRSAAEKFLSDALDLFKIRRCDFEIHPDPAYPGCIYSEMKMCLAPCFAGCTEEQYRDEVGRVRAFLDSGGQSLVRELSEQREQASAGLEFEQAAALHARIEKITAASASAGDRAPTRPAGRSGRAACGGGRLSCAVPLPARRSGRAGAFSRPARGRQAAVDGIADPGDSAGRRTDNASIRCRNHGESRNSEALVLPLHQGRRDFLRG